MLTSCSKGLRRSDALAGFSDDEVFLKDELKRAENVKKEEGLVYRGSYSYISSMKWDYGQVRTQRGGGLVALGQGTGGTGDGWTR